MLSRRGHSTSKTMPAKPAEKMHEPENTSRTGRRWEKRWRRRASRRHLARRDAVENDEKTTSSVDF